LVITLVPNYRVSAQDESRDKNILATACANVSFNNIRSLPTGSTAAGISDLLAVDINLDGRRDIITANRDSKSISIALADRLGDFNAATDIATRGEPIAIVSGDFNSDNRIDLVIANVVINNITILFGNGLGGFNLSTNINLLAAPVALAAADFNIDGKLDLIVLTANSVVIFSGNGVGAFRIVNNFPVSSPTTIAVGDINNDGKPDLVIGSSTDLSLLLGNGMGDFNITFTLMVPIQSLVIADFNMDGKLDVAFSKQVFEEVVVGFGDGVGRLSNFYNADFSVRALVLVAGDFNNDGKPDLVCSGSYGLFILYSIGNGEFVNISLAPFFTFSKVITNDLNGDNRLDLLLYPDFNNLGVVVISFGIEVGIFSRLKPVAIASFPQSPISADFNRDGRADIAVLTEPSQITIFLSDSFNRFLVLPRIKLAKAPRSMITNDFNRDNNLDLVIVNAYSNDITVLLGNGRGDFGTPVNIDVNGYPEAIVAGNFNRDSKMDLAVVVNGSTISVLLGNGFGGFRAPIDTSLNTYVVSLATGDFNRDGKLDLVTTNGMSVSILLGDGMGALQLISEIPLPVDRFAFTRSVEIVTADFNGDANVDIAVSSPDFEGGGKIYALLGNGNATFSELIQSQVLPEGFYFYKSILTADFNSDGKIDLATSGFSSSNRSVNLIAVSLGNGDGTFSTQNTIATGMFQLLTSADFNSDGRPDLASANKWSHNIAILQNNCN
ncbi:MAG: VCBS repeat-containing protein, partial [Acidobacteriota bacterium]